MRRARRLIYGFTRFVQFILIFPSLLPLNILTNFTSKLHTYDERTTVVFCWFPLLDTEIRPPAPFALMTEDAVGHVLDLFESYICLLRHSSMKTQSMARS